MPGRARGRRAILNELHVDERRTRGVNTREGEGCAHNGPPEGGPYDYTVRLKADPTTIRSA